MLNQTILDTRQEAPAFWQADQAAGLRNLLQPAVLPQICLLLNANDVENQSLLAARWSVDAMESGRATLLLDQTCGQAAAALGLSARYELAHTLNGSMTVNQVTLHYPSQVCSLAVLPCARGLGKLSTAPEHLFETVRAASAGHVMPEYIVINGDSQKLDGLVAFSAPQRVAADSEIRLLVPAHAQGLKRAYGLLKDISQRGFGFPIRILISHAGDAQQAAQSFANLSNTCARFLGVSVDYAGYLSEADANPSGLHQQAAATPPFAARRNRHV